MFPEPIPLHLKLDLDGRVESEPSRSREVAFEQLTELRGLLARAWFRKLLVAAAAGETSARAAENYREPAAHDSTVLHGVLNVSG